MQYIQGIVSLTFLGLTGYSIYAFFHNKKQGIKMDKKIRYSIITGFLAIFGITAIIGPAENNNNNEKQHSTTNKKSESNVSKIESSSDKKSSVNNKKSESTKNDKKSSPDFSKVKLGMTKEKVINILGKPDSDNDQIITYDNGGNLYFENGKLTGGDPKSIQNQVNKKSSESKKTTKSNASNEKSAGQVFGSKSTQKLAEQSQYIPHTQLSNGNMMYLDTISNVKMYRIDDYQTGVTTVYKADKSKDDGRGSVLYQGQTITQDKPKSRVSYD
ncbi:hypothetical protein GHU05_04785 [Fructobacillus tropaeoli]|uniref:hypothetical protein n=1 Tax=Fructobacillus tropaeoli TaxID=709323 RepID=UPI0014560BDE|nr:hypothetical protein [Fructobacillus tropaeoli]NLS38243.1 hypothetical protein [Fructobacillus tropaeoli]